MKGGAPRGDERGGAGRGRGGAGGSEEVVQKHVGRLQRQWFYLQSLDRYHYRGLTNATVRLLGAQ